MLYVVSLVCPSIDIVEWDKLVLHVRAPGWLVVLRNVHLNSGWQDVGARWVFIRMLWLVISALRITAALKAGAVWLNIFRGVPDLQFLVVAIRVEFIGRVLHVLWPSLMLVAIDMEISHALGQVDAVVLADSSLAAYRLDVLPSTQVTTNLVVIKIVQRWMSWLGKLICLGVVTFTVEVGIKGRARVLILQQLADGLLNLDLLVGWVGFKILSWVAVIGSCVIFIGVRILELLLRLVLLLILVLLSLVMLIFILVKWGLKVNQSVPHRKRGVNHKCEDRCPGALTCLCSSSLCLS